MLLQVEATHNLFGEVEAEAPTEGSLKWAVELLSEFGRQSVEEHGLYTGTAAARLIGVSQTRVWELGKQGKLTVFAFPHGKFYSGRELKARLLAENKKGGRPKLLDHSKIDW
jgi:hypothetical protein